MYRLISSPSCPVTDGIRTSARASAIVSSRSILERMSARSVSDEVATSVPPEMCGDLEVNCTRFTLNLTLSQREREQDEPSHCEALPPLQQRWRGGEGVRPASYCITFRIRGSRRSRTQSPMRLIERTTRKIARPGKVASHQAVSR